MLRSTLNVVNIGTIGRGALGPQSSVPPSWNDRTVCHRWLVQQCHSLTQLCRPAVAAVGIALTNDAADLW